MAAPTDNTLSVLEEYKQYLPLKILVAPGSNISRGRNLAIKAATSPIIAVTDAGVVLSPEWLEALIHPLVSGDAAIASGWFEPDPYTDFEVVMGATVLPAPQDVDPEKLLTVQSLCCISQKCLGRSGWISRVAGLWRRSCI